MDIPRDAVVCAARHFVAAHKSALKKTPVDFGEVCIGCESFDRCRADWLETAAPIFEGAGVFPAVFQNALFQRKDGHSENQ